MVFTGAIRMPETPAISDPRRYAMVPARAGRIPISRAPVRLRAVARSALPISVKSKNRNSKPLNTSAAARISTVCPET